MLLGGCAAPTEATPLNPLFSADPNTGSYEVDPQAPRLPRAPAPDRRSEPVAEPAPAACKHLYESYATHSYRDPLTGLPALCAVVRCAKCGEIRHECQKGPRR